MDLVDPGRCLALLRQLRDLTVEHFHVRGWLSICAFVWLVFAVIFSLDRRPADLCQEPNHETSVCCFPSHFTVLKCLYAQKIDPVQPTRDDASLKDVLVTQVNGFLLAWEKLDAAALTATMAPEFLYVSSQGVAPREGVVAGLTHACTLTSYSLSDVQLMKISSESAALVYKIHQTASCAGHPEPSVVLNTDTFVRRGGKWVFLLTTSTSVQ